MKTSSLPARLRAARLLLRMLGSMSQPLRVLVGLVEDLTLKDVETRFLNWLVARCPRGATGAAVVELGSTKHVLAAELATSSATLSRAFAKLRDDGLIAGRGGTVRIASVAALQARFRRLLGEGGAAGFAPRGDAARRFSGMPPAPAVLATTTRDAAGVPAPTCPPRPAPSRRCARRGAC